MFSSKVFALKILPQNGSQLPDIHSFSDFTDLLSDMPGKGKFVFLNFITANDVCSETKTVYAACSRCNIQNNNPTLLQTSAIVLFLYVKALRFRCASRCRSNSQSFVPTTTCFVHPACKCG